MTFIQILISAIILCAFIFGSFWAILEKRNRRQIKKMDDNFDKWIKENFPDKNLNK